MKFLFIFLVLFCIIINLLSFIYCFVQSRRTKRVSATATSGKNDSIKGKKNFLNCISSLFQLSSLLRLNLFLVSYIPSHTIRNFLYKNIFRVKMGKNVVIYYGAEIRAPWNLEIGEGSIIGDKSILDARNGIKIGKNCNFSTEVWIWTEQHSVNDEGFSCEGAPVIIEDRCWLGPRTIVLPGKTMKEGSVLAAGAVLTKNTEPFSINGGIPAKKIGERNRNINYEFEGKHFHFL